MVLFLVPADMYLVFDVEGAGNCFEELVNAMALFGTDLGEVKAFETTQLFGFLYRHFSLCFLISLVTHEHKRALSQILIALDLFNQLSGLLERLLLSQPCDIPTLDVTS